MAHQHVYQRYRLRARLRRAFIHHARAAGQPRVDCVLDPHHYQRLICRPVAVGCVRGAHAAGLTRSTTRPSRRDSFARFRRLARLQRVVGDAPVDRLDRRARCRGVRSRSRRSAGPCGRRARCTRGPHGPERPRLASTRLAAELSTVAVGGSADRMRVDAVCIRYPPGVGARARSRQRRGAGMDLAAVPVTRGGRFLLV